MHVGRPNFRRHDRHLSLGRRIAVRTLAAFVLTFAMLRAVTKEPAKDQAKLDFTTVGDQRFLSRIETADNAYKLAVPSAEALQAATPHPSSASPLSSGSN